MKQLEKDVGAAGGLTVIEAGKVGFGYPKKPVPCKKHKHCF